MSIEAWRNLLTQELADRSSSGRDNVDGGGRSHVENGLREGRERRKREEAGKQVEKVAGMIKEGQEIMPCLGFGDNMGVQHAVASDSPHTSKAEDEFLIIKIDRVLTQAVKRRREA